MHTVLIVVHLMIVLALVVVVLLQRSEGGALGIGGGGGFMSGRAKANALTRTTAWLAAGFFATSIMLAIMAGTNRIAPSLIQQRAAPAGEAAPGGNLLDSLKQQSGDAPAAPAPAEPQAPISGAPQPPAPPAQ